MIAVRRPRHLKLQGRLDRHRLKLPVSDLVTCTVVADPDGAGVERGEPSTRKRDISQHGAISIVKDGLVG